MHFLFASLWRSANSLLHTTAAHGFRGPGRRLRVSQTLPRSSPLAQEPRTGLSRYNPRKGKQPRTAFLGQAHPVITTASHDLHPITSSSSSSPREKNRPPHPNPNLQQQQERSATAAALTLNTGRPLPEAAATETHQRRGGRRRGQRRQNPSQPEDNKKHGAAAPSVVASSSHPTSAPMVPGTATAITNAAAPAAAPAAAVAAAAVVIAAAAPGVTQNAVGSPSTVATAGRVRTAGPPPAATSATASASAPVYVFWDLDNKYPETLDHHGLVDRMRQLLRPYGTVVEIRAYANYQTLNFVPKVWEKALLLGVEQPHTTPGEELRCTVCGAIFAHECRLRSHFRQLHQREHQKRLAHRPEAQKYIQSGGYTRYEATARDLLARKKRGYDLEGILRNLGVKVTVVPMGPQRADVVLAGEATKLLCKQQQQQQQQQQQKKKRQQQVLLEREKEGEGDTGKEREAEQEGWDEATAIATTAATRTTATTTTTKNSKKKNTTAGMTTNAAAAPFAARSYCGPSPGTSAPPPAPPAVMALVSDDHGFETLLKLFASAGWRTVTVSHSRFKNSEARLPWRSVAAVQ